MLGKLCKLLRTCGIDASYSNEGLAILLDARKERRVVLTRNTHLRDKEGVFFLEHSDPKGQLEQIIEHFDLRSEVHLFSRCIECNAELTTVNKTAVKDKVPYFTYQNFEDFAQCKQCGKVYWKGSHYRNMLREINEIIKQKNC
jgi:uncharacterized protein with PIN domain